MKRTTNRAREALATLACTFVVGCGGSGTGAGKVEAAVETESSDGLAGSYMLFAADLPPNAGPRPVIKLQAGGKALLSGMGPDAEGSYEVKGVVLTLALPGEKHDMVINGRGCLLGGIQMGSFCKGSAKPAGDATSQGDLSSGSVTMGAPTPAVVNTISGSFYTKDGDQQLTFSADGRISLIHWAGNQMTTALGLYEVDGTRITIKMDGAPMVLERKNNEFELTENGAVTVFAAGE